MRQVGERSSRPLAARAFRRLNRLMVECWRLGLGRWINAWPSGSGRILVIGHLGRRSGLPRWTPLNYARIDGDVHCVAGFGAGSDWYRNVIAHPRVEVWLPGQRWLGHVEDVSDHPQRLRLIRDVLIASGFAARLAGVDPRRLDDDALDAATTGYRVLRLRPIPGDRPLPEHPRPGDRAVRGVLMALGAAAAVWGLRRAGQAYSAGRSRRATSIRSPRA